MAVYTLPWGNTMPLLKIARHYDVPYAMTLYLADYHLHGRDIATHEQQEVFASAQLETIRNVEQDVRYVCAWMAATRDGANPDFPKESP